MHASVISTKKSSDHNIGEHPRRRNLRTIWVNQGMQREERRGVYVVGRCGVTHPWLSNAEVICWSYRVLTVVKTTVSENLHRKNQVKGANTIDLQPSRLVFESTPELPMHGAGVIWQSLTVMLRISPQPIMSWMWLCRLFPAWVSEWRASDSICVLTAIHMA